MPLFKALHDVCVAYALPRRPVSYLYSSQGQRFHQIQTHSPGRYPLLRAVPTKPRGFYGTCQMLPDDAGQSVLRKNQWNCREGYPQSSLSRQKTGSGSLP